MGALSGFHHVKFPVADLARTADWYRRVLGLAVEAEMVEDGVVRGLVLVDPDRTMALALRHEPARAAALSGFDALALRVPTREDLTEWRARLDALGEPHGALVTGHRGGRVLVGLRDPDGVEIRLYAD
jgi:catechol 2,3-dioxygenase-like lactoylglutathione lyase family enzyme